MANRFRVEGQFGPDFHEYYDDEDAQTTAQRLSGRSLLISNAVVAFAVIGFASLAVAVAVTVRPTAAAEPVVGHQNAAPGKFMPLLPTQQQAPVPAPPADQPNAGYQGGIIPDTNGYIPPQLMSPGEGPAPVPASPGTPGPAPNPNGPIPIPIIVPFPGWRPRVSAVSPADRANEHLPHAAAVDTVHPVVDAVHPVDPVDAVHPVDPVDAVHAVDPVDAVHAVDPVECAAVDTVNPVVGAAVQLEGAVHFVVETAVECRPAKHAALGGAAAHTDGADRGPEAGQPAAGDAAAQRPPLTAMPDVVTVVLPCLNEEESLPAVLAAIPAGYRALVVDNNSTDDTAAVARRHGAQVVAEARAGYGSAVHGRVLSPRRPRSWR